MDFQSSLHIVLWAAMLVSWFCLLRKSNLVPASAAAFNPVKHLCRNSFVYKNGELVVQLRWSKTNQFQQRVVEIPLPKIPQSILCPVTAVTFMFAKISAPKNSPAFVVPFQRMLFTLTHHSFVSHLRHLLETCGYNSVLFSGHSFRRGLAQYAFMSQGIDVNMLMVTGDWKSNAVYSYLDNDFQTRARFMDCLRDNLIKGSLNK